MLKKNRFIDFGFIKTKESHFYFPELEVNKFLQFLDCKLEDLSIAPSQSIKSDVRLICRDGYYFIVESTMKDENGDVIPNSLSFEDSRCNVTAIHKK